LCVLNRIDRRRNKMIGTPFSSDVCLSCECSPCQCCSTVADNNTTPYWKDLTIPPTPSIIRYIPCYEVHEKTKPHKCPVCNGTGLVSTPPGVPGDSDYTSTSCGPYPCKPCDGLGIIWSNNK